MKRPLALVAATCLALVLSGWPAWPRERQPSLRELQQAARAKPQDPTAHYNLGLKYEAAGYPEKAVKAFQKAISLKADYAEAYYELGKVNTDLGNPHQALQALRRAAELKPDSARFRAGLSDEYNRLGMALVQGDRGAEAESLFQEAIKANPQASDAAQSNLGVAYAQGGRWAQATEAFQEATRLNPDNPQAQYNLGLAYHLQGNNVAAYAQYLVLKRLDPVAANALGARISVPKRKSDAK